MYECLSIGLLSMIMTKRMTYEELCNAVLPVCVKCLFMLEVKKFVTCFSFS